MLIFATRRKTVIYSCLPSCWNIKPEYEWWRFAPLLASWILVCPNTTDYRYIAILNGLWKRTPFGVRFHKPKNLQMI